MKVRARINFSNEEIRRRRENLKYTQADFAEIVGMNINRFQMIEQMKIKPREEEARIIALELDTEIQILFPQGYEKLVEVFGISKTSVASIEPHLIGTDPNTEIKKLDSKIIVDGVLKDLTEKEQRIVEMRYGLNGNDTHTLEEVAMNFNVTRERIRQTEAKIFEKIRDNPKMKGYEY